jgi:glycosyltransferase involved in cell wall biosynthesis/peptidoglycan/xylan/chitin deacetylase (PgdA/CDA1 family)
MTTAQGSRRPRLLILAYACSPTRGSESAVGWNRAMEAAKHFDTWVICEEHEFKPDVIRYIAENGKVPGLNFVFVPMPRRQWSIGQINGGLWYMVLNRWHRRAFAAAQLLHDEIGFDLAHQLTFCGFREPGYLWKLGIPFVWGPIGGTQNYPWRFLAQAGIAGAASEAGRNMLNDFQLRFTHRIRTAARSAASLVAATSTVKRDLEQILGVDTSVVSDIGIARVADIVRQPRPAREPLHILWSGVMQVRKALPLLIDALAQMPPNAPYCLRVLGQGEYFDAWRRLARQRHVDQHIEWLGWLPHGEALQQYAWADVFAFTSLRDTTGTVIAEALAAGLPVVCLDHQGAHDVVADNCGIRIPVTTTGEVARGLRNALMRLALDPAERERLSRGALSRARDFLWSNQGDKMATVYRQAMGISSNGKPKEGRVDKEIIHLAGGVTSNRSERGRSRPQAAASLPRADKTPLLKAFHLLRHSGRQLNHKSTAVRLRAIAQRAAAAVATPMHAAFGSRSRNAFSILMYHRIAPNVSGVPSPTWNVTPEKFRRQMWELLSRGYQPWPLRKLVEYSTKGLPIPPGTFALTFDDGYECVYTNAWPILKELQIPATVFIVTGLLDADGPLPCEDWTVGGSDLVPASAWRPLSKEQCQAISADGLVDLGVHTHWHEDYRHRPEAFRRDMAQSLRTMREMFGKEDVPFAFPYGYAGPELAAVARQSGIICALTTEKKPIEPRTDPFCWGRLNAEQYDSGAGLAAKMSGWYGAIYGCFQAVAHPLRRRPARAELADCDLNESACKTKIQQ